MTVDPRLRKRKQRGSGGALMLNIRVRHIKKKSDPETLRGTVRDALQSLLDKGRMPPGWQFMCVDWKNPERYGWSWRSQWPERNTTDDTEEFNQAFAAVAQDQIRMARVRKV